MDHLRAVRVEEVLRIAWQDVVMGADLTVITRRISDLADIVLERLLSLVQAELDRSYGRPSHGGEKVSAEELEAHLGEHAAVLRAAVAPILDAELGERIGAFVILRGPQPLSLNEVRAFLSGRGVAAFKQPDFLKVVDAFPLTGMGKIDRAALRLTLR